MLRMGTNNPFVGRFAWFSSIMPSNASSFDGFRCNQHNADVQYMIPSDGVLRKNAQVYCFEPNPTTYHAVVAAARKTGFDRQGLKVRQYAVDNKAPGKFLFPKATAVGKEDVGMTEELTGCKDGDTDKCEYVETIKVDYFVKKENLENTTISIMSIDVEGGDFDVLKGAEETLARTEYVEFEFNWKGLWWDQPLQGAIDYMDKNHFVCYWAGFNMLWRITGCSLAEHSGRFWSNVACANTELAPELAFQMEQTFLATLNRPVKRVQTIEHALNEDYFIEGEIFKQGLNHTPPSAMELPLLSVRDRKKKQDAANKAKKDAEKQK